MLKNWEELGEFLAEVENRLGVLENSLPISTPEKTESQQLSEPEWSKKQYDTVQQTRAMVLHLQGKIAELSKKKRDGF